MTISEFSKTAIGTVSLIFSTVLVSVAILTGDQFGLYLMAAGIWLFGYLIGNATQNRRPVNIFGGKVSPWLIAFVTVSSVCVAIFGFSPGTVAWNIPNFNTSIPGQGWHWGAIIWAGLLFLYSLGSPLSSVEPSSMANAVRVISILAILVVYLATKSQLGESEREVSMALVITLCSCIVDFIAAKGSWKIMYRPGHTTPPASDSDIEERLKTPGRAIILLFLADIPSFVAFGVLLAFILWNKNIELDSFASGAVSFQLIASKATFMLVEAGALDRFLIASTAVKAIQPPASKSAAASGSIRGAPI